MGSLIQDLRYAARQLHNNPGFTAVVVLTLALGIGANTAVFSLANWVALRPLPGARDGNALVTVSFARTPKPGASALYGAFIDNTATRVTFPNYQAFAEEVPAFEGLAAEGFNSFVSVAADGVTPQRLLSGFVSANYFGVLGGPLGAGRPFATRDAESGAPLVVIISEPLWADVWSRDPNVVGRTLRMNGQAATVVGVAPRGFKGTALLGSTDLWMPFPALGPVLGIDSKFVLGREYRGIGLEMFGRLAPDATAEAARAQVQLAAARLFAAHPAEAGMLEDVSAVLHRGLGIPLRSREKVDRMLTLLGWIAGILLLITIANVTNLAMFRTARRQEELSVRRALGATRARLFSQFVIENALLGAVAGAGALVLAMWLTGLFRGLAVQGLPAIDRIGLDVRVFGFGLTLAIAAGAIVAVFPTWAVRDSILAVVLKAGGARGTGRRGGVRATMAVIQISASLALLVGSLLFVGTLQNLRSVDVGFDRSVTTFTLPGNVGYTDERYRAFTEALVPRVASIPGISGAGLAMMSPFSGMSLGHRLRAEGSGPDEAGVSITQVMVSTTYFDVLGIPLMAGRRFERRDRPVDERRMFEPGDRSVTPTVISQALGKALFADQDAVGRFLVSSVYGERGVRFDQRYEIVGVVGDARWQQLVGEDAAGPIAYFPLRSAAAGAALLVRSQLPVEALRKAVVDAVTELAPAVPVGEVSTLADRIDRTIAEQRLFAMVTTLLTVLAVALAGVGLYGLIAFSVAERGKEFGIRLALGARARDITDLVAREGALLAGVGSLVGLSAAAALSRLIENRLFGVVALEPRIYLLATALLGLITLAASLIPARSATRVDPMIALRSE